MKSRKKIAKQQITCPFLSLFSVLVFLPLSVLYTLLNTEKSQAKGKPKAEATTVLLQLPFSSKKQSSLFSLFQSFNMPRPGPRPYECVRRAWHSERHQPVRGSLIQEIFRVVNEIHSTATKKNKGWQEKLPVVVLKSEEIMYSKANSEAEYMDLKTLLDRTNDAINTIIRRDKSTETGELLPPCIEAALNLGCTPRRTSRGQRNSNPRCYLNTSNQEPGNVENVTQGNHSVHSEGMAHYSPLMKQTMNATQNLVVRNISGSTNKLPFTSRNVAPSGNKQCLSTENYPASCSIYHLYYGNCFKIEETQHGFENFPNLTSANMDPAKVNVVRNSSYSGNSSPKILETYIRGIPHNQHDIGCDLSLRLGPLSIPRPSVVQNQQEQVKEVGYSYLEGNKFGHLTPQMNKQILFFSNANDPLDMCSSQTSDEGNVDINIRKRKAVSTRPLEDQHFCWQPKLPCSQLNGRMKTAGL